MNYRIDAFNILLEENCIAERYYPLVPLKDSLVKYLKAHGIYTKNDCIEYFDDIYAFFDCEQTALLFKRFLTLYDYPSKIKELKKLDVSPDRRKAFEELWLLPGVKETRAELYYSAGFRTLRDIASASCDEIIDRCSAVISVNNLACSAPLPKEARTHIAVARAYTEYCLPDFSNILICSDFDGTLFCGFIPERNLRAIKYFTDCGGVFSLVSGRNGRDIANGRFPIHIDTVMAGLNGTQIYDVPNKIQIEQAEIGPIGSTISDRILEVFPEIYRMDVVSERGRVSIPREDKELYRQLMQDDYKPIYKAVFYMETSGNDFFPEEAVKICGNDALVSSNGYGGFEITAPYASKGRAASKIKELIGAEILICIGDFQSDVSMFKIADRSFTPSSASEIAKKAATDIVCPVNEGVMGDVAEILTCDIMKVVRESTKQISYDYNRGYSI